MVTAADALRSFVAAVDHEGLGVHGVAIRVGDERAAHRWRSDDRENLYSVSKGVCALAAGIAVDEGLLTLDLTVGEVFPDLPLGDGVAAVTLRHLLTMTSGIDFLWFGHEPVPGPDLAAAMLVRPSRGRVFQYSDASTYVAMRLLASRVGDVRDWLLPRLFDPLGIDDPQWHRCPLGFIVGGTGLELRTEELARIGDLLLDRGRWGDRRLVSAAWVDAMHADWVETGREAPMERYGLATWAGPGDAWRLEGRYGQFVVVHGDAVVTVTGHEEEGEDRISALAVEVTAT
ncbi:serine hydrolase domain-containing protein [Amnibacterium kyonggiense]|uniref:CubicO group peptidase (Beta-lactamase class C family) n=1 Tax=Amnibacterium kyonggiense TaxID=595671 RepID=A0A4R7FSR5_9MICO|nr:serine hydrolase [Amnibacterium kyonggiense]TDS80880.1 CubicO group peptidase (beta-lactamase class C family) [Amnibacterium kyonggiense]